MLLLENHLIPVFGSKYDVDESEVQAFVLQKIEHGLSQKTVKDILIVLKMVLKFGVKKQMAELSATRYSVSYGKNQTEYGSIEPYPSEKDDAIHTGTFYLSEFRRVHLPMYRYAYRRGLRT